MRLRFIIYRHKKYGIVGVLIIKNEGKYIEELIDYYKLIHFDFLYVFDNNSIDNTKKILEHYVKERFVKYIHLNGKARQRDVGNLFLFRFGHLCKYVVLFDADEFLRIKTDNAYMEIDNLFSMYKCLNIGSLAINWQVFGTGGYTNKQKGNVVETFLMRPKNEFYLNDIFKSISIPSNVFSFYNPHYPYLMPKKKLVSTNGSIISGDTSLFNNNGPVFFHYYTKSRDEYFERLKKGNAFTGAQKQIEDLSEIDQDNILDTSLRDYIKEYKNA